MATQVTKPIALDETLQRIATSLENEENSAMSAASSAASIKASADQIAANKKALQTPTTVTDPTSKTVLLAGSQGIDYSKLADAIIAKYQGQTLAGKAQSVKSALDTVRSVQDQTIKTEDSSTPCSYSAGDFFMYDGKLYKASAYFSSVTLTADNISQYAEAQTQTAINALKHRVALNASDIADNASDIADVNNHLEQGFQIVQAKQDATPSSALTDPAGTGIQLVANQKIDYSKLADAIIAQYTGQTLAGKAQAVKTAIDLVKHQTDGIIDVVNGKPFENVRWSGENLGSTFTAEQLAYIQNNEGYQLGLGSYWTDEAQGITWRNLDFNFLLNKGDSALNKYHSLVMPDACLLKGDGSHYMQDSNNNATANGYNGTKYRSTYRSQCKTKFANFFGSHVITHREMLTNASTDGQASGWSWYNCDVELPSEDMIYGSSPWGNSINGGGSGYNVGINYGRIAGFESHPELINASRESYWLRTIFTASHFAVVYAAGDSYYYAASATSVGLRPYALIG